jgi:hypothetical protein
MKTLLWKYYFWAVVALDVVSFVMPLERRVWEMVEIGFFLVALAGLFGYCWEKQLVSRLFWRIFFAVFCCWIPLYFFVLPPTAMQAGLGKTPQVTVFMLAAVTVAVHVPLFAALFLYGFKRSDIWEK